MWEVEDLRRCVWLGFPVQDKILQRLHATDLLCFSIVVVSCPAPGSSSTNRLWNNDEILYLRWGIEGKDPDPDLDIVSGVVGAGPGEARGASRGGGGGRGLGLPSGLEEGEHSLCHCSKYIHQNLVWSVGWLV